jgi:hypothetical protein
MHVFLIINKFYIDVWLILAHFLDEVTELTEEEKIYGHRVKDSWTVDTANFSVATLCVV